MLDVNYNPPAELIPPLAGGHWRRNYENMDTTPLQKNATRTRLNANSETLKRKIEILDVLNEIYAEADESGQTEEGEADKRDLPSVRLHFPRHARTLPTLPKGNTCNCIPQEQDRPPDVQRGTR